MTWIALAARCLLTCVFLMAGLGKFLDLRGSRQAVVDFGVPAWAATSLGFGVPLAEVSVAMLLMPVSTVGIGAVAGFLVSLAFSAAIAINIGLGRKPHCHCFGQFHLTPVGWSTLARSCSLTAVAGFLAWHAESNEEFGIHSAIERLTSAHVLEGIFGAIIIAAIGALFWLVLQLSRQNGRFLLRVEALEAGRRPASPHLRGLPLGTRAVPFDLPTVEGDRATLEDLLREEKPLLLISTNPSCAPCNAIMPDIAAWQRIFAGELKLVLLSHGRLQENRANAAQHRLDNVLMAPDHKIADQYHAAATPTAVIIRADGTIGSPTMGGADAIRQVVTYRAWTDVGLTALLSALGQPSALSRPPIPQILPAGSNAPVFNLPDANGNDISLTSFNGTGTVLLFWNPDCSFCQRMLPQLREWEQRRPVRAPRLVLVSAGSQESNRAMNLESTILTDERLDVGRMYGSVGTPSGVFIDAKGQIGSPLRVGATDVLQLLLGETMRTEAA
jgi:peroxiredoxin